MQTNFNQTFRDQPLMERPLETFSRTLIRHPITTRAQIIWEVSQQVIEVTKTITFVLDELCMFEKRGNLVFYST